MVPEGAARCGVGADFNRARPSEKPGAAELDDGTNEARPDKNESITGRHQKRGREVTRFTHLRKAED